MSSFTDYLEDAVLNHVFRNTALTSPTSVYAALFTSAPTDAGGGTEVSGGGYSRQAVTFGAPSGGAISNSADISWTASGAAFGTVVATAIFDAVTAGNMLSWASITSATINDGDTLTFTAGNYSISLD